MATLREMRLEFGGFGTRSLELTGDSGSDALVLLHGFSDSADTWRPLMDVLARDARRALAVDLPGFGHADRLARDRPILPQLDRFVRGVLTDAAKTSPSGRVVVVGNSLGGCLALRAAQRADAPIAAVVPIAPAGLDMTAWLAMIERSWPVQAVLRSPMPIPAVAVRELMGRAYCMLAANRPAELAPATVAAFTSHFASKRDVVRILGTGRRLLPELREPFELGWIRAPVLVIWGERDRLVNPSGAARVLREIEGARSEVIADCGHCPQVECPERVAELIDSLSVHEVALTAAG